MKTTRPTSRSRGFTLIEVVLVTVIAVILVTLTIVAVSNAIRSARRTADQLYLRSISVGVEQFKNEFNFLPPLVDEVNPLITVTSPSGASIRRPKLQTQLANGQDLPLNQLQVFYGDGVTTVPRFSRLTIPYYMLGVQDGVTDGSVDGVAGAGFTRPTDDGGFTRAGREFAPLFDFSNRSDRFKRVSEDVLTDKTTIVDRAERAVRIYRWEPYYYGSATATPGKVQNYCVPSFIGDPQTDVRLRRGGYAIVSGGPDGVLNQTASPTDRDNADNIVEIGQ